MEFDIIVFFDGKDHETIEHFTLEEAFSEGFVEFRGNEIVPVDDSIIIRPSIGIKDKNDKHIYEGDIYIDSWGSYSLIQKRKYDGKAIMGHGHTDRQITIGYELNFVPKEIEIIGNKYENPEIDYFALEVNNESN
jgi:uncharacterized phage protein (TIGR01671 family)